MLPPTFTRHTITLEALQSDGRYGPTFDVGVPVCGVWVELGRKLVTTPVGEEIASAARVFLPDDAPKVSPGDRVTLPNGHAGLAITVDPFDSPAALAHVEVALS